MPEKSPPELLIPASATPSPSAASHGFTDSESIDLSTEDLSGAATLEFSGGTLSCIWDDNHIEFCMVEGKMGGNSSSAASYLRPGTPSG